MECLPAGAREEDPGGARDTGLSSRPAGSGTERAGIMRNRLHRRAVGFVAALVLVAAPLAVASAAFGADPGVQSTATVANGQELRQQWAIGNNTLITLTADIDLGVDGEGHDI